MAFHCVFSCFLLLGFISFCLSFDFDVCSLNRDNLKVKYATLDVACGSSYSLTKVQSFPVITFPKADTSKLYTVLMVDPDAPSAANPTCRSWIHLIMTNILGNNFAQGISVENIANQDNLKYESPSPPKGSGDHRYFFVAFSQKTRITIDPLPSNRCKFNIDEFIKKHDLLEMSAVNMFKTQQT